jgi:hypothetical protein
MLVALKSFVKWRVVSLSKILGFIVSVLSWRTVYSPNNERQTEGWLRFKRREN